MIKGLIITHGNLGKEIIHVAEKILEQDINIDYISFDWQEDGSKVIKKIEKYLRANQAYKILIFTDMFGGSPSNICLQYNKDNVEILTGVNLPGLLKFISYRNKKLSFKEIVNITKSGSIDGINIIGEFLGEKKG